MVFTLSPLSNKKIKNWYEKCMKELGEFYGINWNENRPVLLLVKNRKEIDLLKGRKTEDWVVGFTDGSKKCLFLLKPESYEEESSHKYSDKEYFALMKHELSHLFSRILYEGYIPKWLVEGIAIYSSGQLELKKEPKQFKQFLEFFEKGGSGLYDESGFAVKILIDKFGKKNFLEFYRSLKEMNSQEDLKKLFKKHYNAELNYKFFNKYL